MHRPAAAAEHTWALILAALVPEKATPILVRGRAYGESRIVCGVHWLSDVVAGRLTGTAVFAALMDGEITVTSPPGQGSTFTLHATFDAPRIESVRVAA